tara:strand:- start:67827 stop:68597 length:771 start_codon:yes stop_codon:yes gene_type:complete
MKYLNFYILTIFILFLSGCSEEAKKYETLIREEAEKNNTEVTDIYVKKTANFLAIWSKEDFYTDEINEFIKKDLSSPPKENQVLFVGSSSIRFWKSLKEDMHPIKVLNRGFGGAHINHVNYHFDQVVKPYKPSGIVFFCGTNDLTALKSASEVMQDFSSFYSRVKSELPGVKVFVIGIKPSIAREYLKLKEIQVNRMIEELASKEDNLEFIDVWDSMLLPNGKANPNLFVDDGLHLNENGYKLWAKIVKPILESYL